MLLKFKKHFLRLILKTTSALASIVLLLLGVTSLAGLWVISHPSAPQTLYNWASTSPLTADYWPDGFAIGALKGPLYQELTLQDLHLPIQDASDADLNELTIEELRLSWLPHRLFLQEVTIKNLDIIRPQLRIKNTNKPEEKTTPLDWASLKDLSFDTADLHQIFTPLTALEWSINLQQLTLVDLQLEQAGQSLDISQAQVGLRWQQQQLILDQLNIEVFNTKVELTGSLHIHSPQHTNISLQGAIHQWDGFSGLPTDLAKQLAELDTTLPAMTFNGHLNLHEDQLSIHLDLSGPIDISLQQKLAGNEQAVDWDTRIELRRSDHDLLSRLKLPLALEHFQLTSQGQGSWYAQSLEAHQQLQLQIGQLPTISLQNRIGFQPNVYDETEINAQLAFTLANHGTVHQALMVNLDNKTGQLLVNTKGFALPGTQRDNRQAWSLSLETAVHLLDWDTRSIILSIPEINLEGLPAPFKFSGHALSQLTNSNTYQLDWLTSDVSYGEVKGEFDVMLQLAKDRSQFLLDSLRFQLGDAQLSLTAQLENDLHINLNLSAPNLTTLHPDIAGSLQGTVQVHQTVDRTDWIDSLRSAQLDQSWQVKQLEWLNNLLEDARLTTSGSLENLLTHDINFTVNNLTDKKAGMPLLEKLEFNRHAVANETHNHLRLTQPELSLNIHLNDSWPKPINIDALKDWQTWQKTGITPHFTLDELSIDAPIIGTWQLLETTHGHWQGLAEGLTLNPLCLQQGTTATFCIESEQHRIRWQGQQLPWQAWLAPFKPDNITLLGEFTIQGRLDWHPPMSAHNPSENIDWNLNNSINWPYFFINVQTPEVALPLTVLNWRNELGVTPNQLHLTSRAQLNQQGELDTEIKLSKLATDSWSDAKIDGQFLLKIVDLYLAEDWQNLLTIHQQRLKLSGALSGNVSAPDIQGHLDLALDFDLPLLGLADQRVEITSAVNYPISAAAPLTLNGRWLQPQDNQVDLSISYDPSLLTPADTDLDNTTTAPIFIRVDSENVQLLNTSLGDINSQIGIQINYHPNAIQVLGGIKLQNTQLNLALETGQSRTPISGDEVLLDAQGQPVIIEETGLPLFLDFTVGFGEDVQIRGLDARIWLGGEINLAQTPQRPETQGFGEVRIERGHLNIDRRNRIEIDRSSFNFNGPLDNPRLDVNLFRVVDQTTARLNITGQATRPQFVFYATPTQSQARIINMLIFGRAGDLQNEPNYESQMLTALYKLGLQNNLPILNDLTQTLGIEDIYFDVQDREVNNLMLGRAINEQIYINYAHNLSGVGQSAVQVFFNLTPNWLIKSESGENSNAIDLIYRLER